MFIEFVQQLLLSLRSEVLKIWVALNLVSDLTK
jgi:hypothetical protein